LIRPAKPGPFHPSGSARGARHQEERDQQHHRHHGDEQRRDDQLGADLVEQAPEREPAEADGAPDGEDPERQIGAGLDDVGQGQAEGSEQPHQRRRKQDPALPLAQQEDARALEPAPRRCLRSWSWKQARGHRETAAIRRL
jgi:hypothetical protein